MNPSNLQNSQNLSTYLNKNQLYSIVNLQILVLFQIGYYNNKIHIYNICNVVLNVKVYKTPCNQNCVTSTLNIRQ